MRCPTFKLPYLLFNLFYSLLFNFKGCKQEKTVSRSLGCSHIDKKENEPAGLNVHGCRFKHEKRQQQQLLLHLHTNTTNPARLQSRFTRLYTFLPRRWRWRWRAARKTFHQRWDKDRTEDRVWLSHTSSPFCLCGGFQRHNSSPSLFS